jgi:uncharacterized membrane protein
MASRRGTTARRPWIAAVAAAVGFVTLALTWTGASAQPQSKGDSGPNLRTFAPVFVLDKGRFTAFDAPGGGPNEPAIGINNRGQIVAGYRTGTPGASCIRGFRRDSGGRFKAIDVPGAELTQPIDINDRRQIVGNFKQADSCQSAVDAPLRGFVRSRRGRITTIRVPGSAYTQAAGINDRGHVVGEYGDQGGTVHGYVWRKGRFTTIDRPDATATTLLDINDRGEMVGSYLDAAGVAHGFVRDRDGRVITFDALGARYTLPFGINNRGQVAGWATDDFASQAGTRGFVLRKGADGPVTPVEVPGALGTAATDIDDAGRIVGIYGNPDYKSRARRAEGMSPTGSLVEALGLAG